MSIAFCAVLLFSAAAAAAARFGLQATVQEEERDWWGKWDPESPLLFGLVMDAAPNFSYTALFHSSVGCGLSSCQLVSSCGLFRPPLCVDGVSRKRKTR